MSPCWTLEHDLALSGLAFEVHRAVTLARKSKALAKVGKVLTPQQWTEIEEDTRRDWTEFSGLCCGDSKMLACKIYEPLYRKRASKAEAAEILASILDADSRSPEDLRKVLPPYLTEAIDYVTRQETKGDRDHK